jgi:uncharacterized protein YqgV (UPF0045/DUF77 family)
MYPLDDNFIEPITFFIKRLKIYPFISIETNGMSTQIFGDYDNIMIAIQKEMKNSFLLQQNVVFNLKVVNAHLQDKSNIQK